MRKDTFETPVLFVIFNRPELTQQVFEAIRSIRPRTLFIAADGPRSSNSQDVHRCAAARQVVSKVDWPCDVQTRFLEENLGCRQAVSSAIDWFFSRNEEGIILEDDCLPCEDFFRYCEIMLNRYRNEKQIMHIGGTNFQDGIRRGREDIYFSRFSHVWGWATWRRAWLAYDVNMASYPSDPIDQMLSKISSNRYFANYWKSIFEMTYKNLIDTWDYQWLYAIWRSDGLCIIPQENLISNIGFGPETTHTHGPSPYAQMETRPFRPMHFPIQMTPNTEADAYTARKHFNIPSGWATFSRKILNAANFLTLGKKAARKAWHVTKRLLGDT